MLVLLLFNAIFHRVYVYLLGVKLVNLDIFVRVFRDSVSLLVFRMLLLFRLYFMLYTSWRMCLFFLVSYGDFFLRLSWIGLSRDRERDLSRSSELSKILLEFCPSTSCFPLSCLNDFSRFEKELLRMLRFLVLLERRDIALGSLGSGGGFFFSIGSSMLKLS